jgi:hypothetical protein
MIPLHPHNDVLHDEWRQGNIKSIGSRAAEQTDNSGLGRRRCRCPGGEAFPELAGALYFFSHKA